MVEAITGALITGIFTIIGAVIPVLFTRKDSTTETNKVQTDTNNNSRPTMKKLNALQSLIGGFIGGFIGAISAWLLFTSPFLQPTTSAVPNQSANNPTSLPVAASPSAAMIQPYTATLIPVNDLSSYQITSATLALTKSFETTAEAILTRKTPVSATIELSYLRLQGDRLLLFARLTTDECLSFLSRPNESHTPSLIKEGYSGPSNILQRGGVFLQSTICNVNNEGGWLVYQIDPSTFSLHGLYTFDLIAQIKLEDALAYSPRFPLINFEVP